VTIHNLNIEYIAFAPDKTNSPLVIDPNAALAEATAAERLETIARRRSQVPEFHGAIQHPEFPLRYTLDGPKPFAVLAVKKPLGFRAAKRFDHPTSV
jgi:hypothetical protein